MLMKYLVLLVLAAVTIGYLVLDVRRLASIDEALAFADSIDVYPLPAEIDVNGDGQPGRLRAMASESAYTQAILVDDGREWLRFPYVDFGDAFRTSVGWVPDPTGGRFYIFNGTNGPRDMSETVYRFDGQALIRVEPDVADRQVLNALSSQTMYGRGLSVAAYHRFRPHVWFWLLAVDLLALIAVLASRRSARARPN